MLRRIIFWGLIMLCVFQVAVPAWGVVLCIGERGHVAIELMTGCTLKPPEDTCESSGEPGFCPRCYSEEDHGDCNDISPPPFSLSYRTKIHATPDIHNGWAVSSAGLRAGSPAFLAAANSGDIFNPFLIQNGTRHIFSCVVLQI